jgi:hypothetical protein
MPTNTSQTQRVTSKLNVSKLATCQVYTKLRSNSLMVPNWMVGGDGPTQSQKLQST